MRPTRLRLAPEALERRDVPAVTATLTDGLLSVVGSDGPDRLVVRLGGNELVVAGVARTFPRTAVTRVEVSGLGGDDRIDVSGVPQAGTIDGGAGADTIRLDAGGGFQILGQEPTDVVEENDPQTTRPYAGSLRIVSMASAGGGFVTLFSSGGVYFSPDGWNLGGNGGTVPAYTGSYRVLAIAAVNGGVVTQFDSGGVYLSPTGKNLGGGGSTTVVYGGTQVVERITPAAGGVVTTFRGGAVYFSPNGRDLGGGGSTVVAYSGAQRVAWQQAYKGGVLTQFDGGAVYFSPNGRNVGGGAGTTVAYAGVNRLNAVVDLPTATLAWFASGGLYSSPDGMNLGGGGGTALAAGGVVQLDVTPGGRVYALTADDDLLSSADGRPRTYQVIARDVESFVLEPQGGIAVTKATRPPAQPLPQASGATGWKYSGRADLVIDPALHLADDAGLARKQVTVNWDLSVSGSASRASALAAGRAAFLTYLGQLAGWRLATLDAASIGESVTFTPPVASLVGGATVTEGNDGRRPAGVVVRLSGASPEPVTVRYSVRNESTSADDYDAGAGSVTFNPGETTKGLPIAVLGDTAFERDEIFWVRLTGATNASAGGQPEVPVVIQNDDAGSPIDYVALRWEDLDPFTPGWDAFLVNTAGRSIRVAVLVQTTENGVALSDTTATYFVPPGGKVPVGPESTRYVPGAGIGPTLERRYKYRITSADFADGARSAALSPTLDADGFALAMDPVRPVVVGGAADGSVGVTSAATGGVTGAVPGPGSAPTRPAAADVNGDGVADIITVTGVGTALRVSVVSGAGGAVLVAPFDPFGGDFLGGGYVTAGDLDGDGRAEFAVTPDQGGGPRVTVFSLNPDGTAAVRANFLGIDDTAFRGGARAAIGDVNGDGTPDLVVAAGFGGGPRTAIFEGGSVLAGNPTRLVADFFAFPGADASNLRNGSFVAAGDITGDGFADLVFGGGPGGAPRVFILSGALVSAGNAAGAQAAPVANFFVGGDLSDRGGARVAVTNTDGDGMADLAVGSGAGRPAKVKVYLGKDVTGPGEPTSTDLDPFGGAVLADGVYVG